MSQTSEQYLDRITDIPPAIVQGPSPGLSQPDEGSIAEKEFSSFDEKRDEQGGFFEPDVVDKELANLMVGGKESTDPVAGGKELSNLRPERDARETILK